MRILTGIPLRKGDKGAHLEDTVGVLDYDPVGTPGRSVEEMNVWDFGRGIQVGNFGSLVGAFGTVAIVVATCAVEHGS